MDAASPKTGIVAAPSSQIFFGGAYQVNPISQDKFEILFYPATGGSGKYNYIIYVGDNPFPETVPSEVLLQDYRGLLKHTVKGLETGKSYYVKVEARDQKDDGKDDNQVVLQATTFLNLVADFSGIALVSNTAGVDGLDSIKVRWPHAYVDVGSVGGSTTDPVSYEITAVDTTLLTPANMDDKEKGPNQGRFTKSVVYSSMVNETILRGLRADTKYYVRVRAIHKSSVDDVNNPRLRGEMNTNYLSIKTLSSDLSSIKFQTGGLQVSRNEGSAQSSSLVLTWPTASGVFDHFRVYYSQNQADLASVDTDTCNVAPEEGCKKYDPTATGAIIPNLEANKDYYFKLIVCQFESCESFIPGDIKQGSTKPVLANFPGITSIRSASNINEIGKIFVTFSLPNFNEGNFDGYHIAYRANASQEKEIISDSAYIGSLTYDDFDYRTATSITITNVDYSLETSYCITVFPFVWDTDEPSGYKSYDENMNELCTTSKVISADMDQFPGLISAEMIGNDVLVSWDNPLAGIFDLYEVYIRKTSGTFSYSAARTQIAGGNYANYSTVLVDGGLNTYRFVNIPNGTYKVGVLTYFAYIPPEGDPVVYRSEDNEGIFTCVVNGTMADCVPGN